MSITGYLTDFSLPEIFEFIAKGKKTGLLKLWTLSESPRMPVRRYYIWMYNGRIVAAANRLDDQGLVSLIEQQQWMSDRVLDKLVNWCCPYDEPLGCFLKNHGVLKAAQLKKLFIFQVLQPLSYWFKLQNGLFKFQENMPIPRREMTGFSISTTEATLRGLRTLKNWDALASQLPDPNAGLVSIIAGQPRYRLNHLEWQVWEYTKGTVSLWAIAQQLRLPVESVQQIAFRLIAVGLAQEVPLLIDHIPTPEIESLSAELIAEVKMQKVSQSFMHNLIGFLRNKSQDYIN